MATSAMSKGFFEFVKSIGEAKSKQEEDKIIANELEVLKVKMAGKNVAPRQMREYLIRMVYVEMLGHDASFGHIHAVKLTRALKLVDKRVGYMACSLCLHKDHELMLLLVGGLQTDLQSQNQLEAATALIVACKLINTDTIPAVLPLVTKLLSHAEASIRKKAIMTLHRFWELNASSITDIADKAKRMLCDKDPSVMGASLHLLNDLMEQEVNQFKDLVSSFVSILKQIIEHRLPKDYDYHRMPAPWIQIRLLQILGHLGQADKSASEGMYEVLHEVMRRADIGINVGYAIIYECVRTVTTIYPNAQLLAEAAKCTSRFITSDNHNLKYLGINALASIVQVNPNAAKEHQMVVIDCLEDKDETLRRKTLDLLFRMTNDHNVKVICMKFLVSLKDSVDVYLRQELIEKITSLAESYAPDPIWYIETMTEVFELGGELVQEQIAHNFIKHVALGIEQAGDDGDEDELDRDAKNSDVAQYVADFFLEQLDHIRIPNILLKVVAWVLGEYGHLATGHLDEASKPGQEQEQKEETQEKVVYPPLSPVTVILKLWDVVEKQGENYETRMWTMAATCKLIKHLNPIPSEIVEIIQKYGQAINSDLQQLAGELLEMVKERQMLANVFASSNITDDIVVDEKLSFLDTYVSDYIRSHPGREYRPTSTEKKSEQFSLGKNPKHKELRLVHREATDTTMVEEVAVGPTSHPIAKTFTLPSQSSEADIERSSLFTSGTLGRTTNVGKWSEKGYETANGQSANQDDEYPETVTTTNTNLNTSTTSSAPSTKVEPTQITKSIEPSAHVTEKVVPAKKVPESAQSTEMKALFDGDAKAAADLFGKKLGRKKSRLSSTTKIIPTYSQTNVSSTAVSKKIEPEEKHDTDNLLDFVVSEQPQQQSSSKQVSKPKPTTAPSTSTATKPTTSTASTSGGLLDDLFGPAVTTTQKTSSSADTFDILSGTSDQNPLGDILGSMTGVSAMSSSGGKRGFAALSELHSKFSMYPRYPNNDEPLSSSINCQVTYFKMYKQQQTSLCLFIANVSTAQMTNVTIGINLPSTTSNLQVGFDVSNSIPKPKLMNARTAVIDNIAANQTIGQFISIGTTNPLAVQLPVSINVTIAYQVGVSKEQLTATVAIAGRDLLRSCAMDTATFGKNWPAMKNETKVVVTPSTCPSLPDYLARIKQLQLNHIQTINLECIAAAQLPSIDAANTLPVLVHCKKEPSGFTCLVRTMNPYVGKAIAQELQQILS